MSGSFLKVVKRLNGEISDGCGMLREQLFEFHQKLRHFGVLGSRSSFAECPDPVFKGIYFHKYEC